LVWKWKKPTIWQLGQEPPPEAYVEALVETLYGWIRVLRSHASVFLNLGDAYQNRRLCNLLSLSVGGPLAEEMVRKL
jgi:hypothetical protein